jgi:mannose/cellobiose epimerase-like protein (N-acyl-D-glucosamine 2-epimerase family)
MNPIPFADIRAWMFRDALPFWAEYGVDGANGGFLEELAQDGARLPLPRTANS